MNARRLLARASAAIDAVLEPATSLFLAIILVINGVELSARNLANYSFVWAHEINLLLANWVYFLGIVLVYRRGGDVVVGFIFDRLGPRARRVWAVACHAVSAVVFAVIAVEGWALVELQWPFHSTGLGVPNPAFSAPVAVGGALLVVILADRILATLDGREAPAGGSP
jgi:TRAP-type C4-dicarboxylate transport system permease small subunit